MTEIALYIEYDVHCFECTLTRVHSLVKTHACKECCVILQCDIQQNAFNADTCLCKSKVDCPHYICNTMSTRVHFLVKTRNVV